MPYPTGWTTELVQYALAWLAVWTALYYVLIFTAPYWMRLLPKSTKDHENSVFWNAAQVASLIHSVYITAVSVPSLFALTGAPAIFQYPPFEGEQPWCSVPDDIFATHGQFQSVYGHLATAGLAFTMHLLSDVITSMVHRTATPQIVVHHFAFISVGLIVRGHCMLPFNSAALMAMEASTPFLNLMMLLRNRGNKYAVAVKVLLCLFLVLFVIFRLFLNTYSVAVLLANHATVAPPSAPAWRVKFFLAALSAGASVQYFFFFQILKAFGAQAKLVEDPKGPRVHREALAVTEGCDPRHFTCQGAPCDASAEKVSLKVVAIKSQGKEASAAFPCVYRRPVASASLSLGGLRGTLRKAASLATFPRCLSKGGRIPVKAC